MTEVITETAGCDIGDKYSHVCVLDNAGEVQLRARLMTSQAGFRKWFSTRPRSTVVVEVGTHSRWVQGILKNHTVWACDFLQTYDIWFRHLFAFFVIDVNTKQVIHGAVTREPTQSWTAQQLRQLTPFGTGPDFIVRARDTKFGSEFDRVAKSSGVRVLKTAFRSPLMNATCERFLGSVRRECLDHVIVLSERHLRSVLLEYVAFFNASRPHRGIPATRPLSVHGDRLQSQPTRPRFYSIWRTPL